MTGVARSSVVAPALHRFRCPSVRTVLMVFSSGLLALLLPGCGKGAKSASAGIGSGNDYLPVSSCSNVCDSSCSDYSPSSCGTSTTGTAGSSGGSGSCTDSCDASCGNYDASACDGGGIGAGSGDSGDDGCDASCDNGGDTGGDPGDGLGDGGSDSGGDTGDGGDGGDGGDDDGGSVRGNGGSKLVLPSNNHHSLRLTQMNWLPPAPAQLSSSSISRSMDEGPKFQGTTEAALSAGGRDHQSAGGQDVQSH